MITSAPVSLEGAAEVVQFDARHERNEAVGHDARDVALQGIVLAVLAPAEQTSKPSLSLSSSLGDVAGIVLQVAIHRNDHIAAREVEAGHHRRRLAVITAEVHHFDGRIFRGEAVEHARAGVVAAVIDEDELHGWPTFFRTAVTRSARMESASASL
ncbi:MAG: hypothetical protein WDN28_28960 [Chthoniobacter sp.]